MIFKCTIPGRCPSKKNTKKVVRRHGSVNVIYTKQFREWETIALFTLKQAWLGRETVSVPVKATIKFYFKNHQNEPDLTNVAEAPQDALQKAGVIKDDKLIWLAHLQKFFDDDNPRTEIVLEDYR